MYQTHYPASSRFTKRTSSRPVSRARHYFGEPSQPRSPARAGSIRPTSQELSFEQSEDWNVDSATLTFLGDDTDMLAILELFYREATPDVKAMRSSLRPASLETRLVPPEWRMSEE